MRLAVELIVERLRADPQLLPAGFSLNAFHSLLTFSLDKSYFEFNHSFFRQVEGGPMGSPLTVDLAEIRVADLETKALESSPDPPSFYVHFVDDGYGRFRDEEHANSFHLHINSLSSDLKYTIEHQASDGSLPFLDVLVHGDLSTSPYRKPTHTNIYQNGTSCAPGSTKDSVIRSLTTRAYRLCSPQHLDSELSFLRTTFLNNGHTQHRIATVMEQVRLSINRPKRPRPPSTSIGHATIPYHNTLARPVKKILRDHQIDTFFSSAPTLRNLLCKTKSTPPTDTTPANNVYLQECATVPCNASYIGKSFRAPVTRVGEHERAYRLNNLVDDAGNIKSAPAQHTRFNRHTFDWNDTSILCTTHTRPQMDFAEHMAITGRKPSLNRTDKANGVNPNWNSLAARICSSFRPRPSDITKF